MPGAQIDAAAVHTHGAEAGVPFYIDRAAPHGAAGDTFYHDTLAAYPVPDVPLDQVMFYDNLLVRSSSEPSVQILKTHILSDDALGRPPLSVLYCLRAGARLFAGVLDSQDVQLFLDFVVPGRHQVDLPFVPHLRVQPFDQAGTLGGDIPAALALVEAPAEAAAQGRQGGGADVDRVGPQVYHKACKKAVHEPAPCGTVP